jgi:hypothetical protein
MRIHIPCTAAGLALAALAPAAHAETIVTRQIVSQPVETVRTVTTTRTVRPIIHRRVVVTRRTTVSEHVVPVAPAPAPVAAAYPRPVYDVVAPPPAVPAPYARPVYDVVTPAPAVAAPVVDETVVAPAAPVAVGTAVPAYRYVYQPDRILVIDPATGIAVQALPR